jgi:hypothetical protein
LLLNCAKEQQRSNYSSNHTEQQPKTSIIMAAVLCGSISNLCEGICSLPCTLCSKSCTLCSKGCKPLCEGVKKFTESSFCVYNLVVLGLNIPPLVYALTVIAYPLCRGTQWLGVDAAFCVAHIVAAFYLSKNSNTWDDTVQTICHDLWMAGYILVYIASLIWLSIGVSWNRQGVMANGNCPDDVAALTANSYYCGFAFIGFGSVALMISLMVSWCRGKNGKTTSTKTASTSYSPPSNGNPLSMC